MVSDLMAHISRQSLSQGESIQMLFTVSEVWREKEHDKLYLCYFSAPLTEPTHAITNTLD